MIEVDPQVEPTVETQDQPMETEQLESPPGTFQSELTSLRYTPSLIGSADSLPSPMTAADNALLDTPDPEVPGPDQSKAPGASHLEGSPKSKITLRNWKTP